MKITVRLSCGHKQEWADDPEMPGAALPYRAASVICNTCGELSVVTRSSPALLVMSETDNGVSVIYDVMASTAHWIVHYIGDLARYAERARAEEVARVVDRAIGFMEGKQPQDT